MFVNIILVFDELILHLLSQICAISTQLWRTINHVLHQMEAVYGVLYPHVKARCYRSLFNIPPDMQIAVGAAIGRASSARVDPSRGTRICSNIEVLLFSVGSMVLPSSFLIGGS